MYIWYFNGVFPPPQEEAGCQETENSVQSPALSISSPSLMQKMKLQVLSTKPKVQSSHFMHRGKGHPWPRYLSGTLKRGFFGPH